MPFPPLTPLEINDFSGGITDHYLEADPRRSQVLNNFLIEANKSIIMRPGFDYLAGENYLLPGNPDGINKKVSGLYFLMPEKLLFALESRRLFVTNPAQQGSLWVEMSGLNSQNAVEGGDEKSQVSVAEFQRHAYLASDGLDGQGVRPSKIYQDTSNVWRAKTAGLPKAYVAGAYTEASLLAKCITNANALKTAMIAHMQDAISATYVAFTTELTDMALHMNRDRFSLSYLTSISFSSDILTGDPEVPSPLPTPAADASSEATLFTLVGALNSAYTHHVAESSGGSLNPSSPLVSNYAPYNLSGTTGSQVPNATAFYHMRPLVNASTSVTASSALQKPQMGPHATLTSSATPTTVESAAAMLDDLLQKWNWHREAVWTHSPSNNPAQFDKYTPQCTAIGTVTTDLSTPAVTPDFSDIVNYANNLKTIYNAHINSNATLAQVPGNFAHTRASHPKYNLDLTVRLNDAVDLDSAYLLIYWVRAMYYLHYRDAAVTGAFVGFTYTSTSGSITLSAVTRTSDGSAIAAFPVSYMTTGALQGGMSFQAFAGESQVRMAYLPFSSLNMDRKATSSVVGKLAQYSQSVYHCSSLNGAFVDSATGALGQSTDAMANAVNSLGSDTATWLELASDVFYALSSHMSYRNVHIPGYVNYAAVPAAIIASTATPFFLPEVSQVSYAFFFSDEYDTGVNNLTYLVRSNPVISAVTQVATSYPVNYTIQSETPTVYPSIVNGFTRVNELTGLPVLVNDGASNYDTANVMLNIYRTTNGGLTYYLLAQVANGTTSYSDSTHDTLSSASGSGALNDGQTMYTTGGTVGSDQPPQAKFVHIFNGTAYYAGIVDNGQYFPNQLRQSVQNSPEWAPSTFFDNLDDEITGISSTKANVIALCKTSVYRMSGGFSQTGQGSITHDRISDEIGSLNSRGIIKTEIGVFFAGNDGFYYTDGYQVIKISLEIDTTYAKLTQSDEQKRAIHGAYDRSTRRIWWAMQTTESTANTAVVYVFYLNFGVKPSGVFSTVTMDVREMSGFITNSEVTAYDFASALAFDKKGNCYASLAGGFLVKSNPDSKYDLRGLNPITVDNPTGVGFMIPYEWVSSSINLGTNAQRKYMTRLHATGQNCGNMAMQFQAIKDLNQTGAGALNFAGMQYNYNCSWGTPTVSWGQAAQVWKSEDGKLDAWRRFPKNSLRSDSMQIRLAPLWGVIYASENGMYPSGAYAVVGASGFVHSVSLVTPPGYTELVWMDDVYGCAIKFSYDNYATEYVITNSDGLNGVANVRLGISTAPPNGTYKWEIWGYRKNQRPSVSSVQLTYSYTGDKNQKYGGATASTGGGENP